VNQAAGVAVPLLLLLSIQVCCVCIIKRPCTKVAAPHNLYCPCARVRTRFKLASKQVASGEFVVTFNIRSIDPVLHQHHCLVELYHTDYHHPL
jgi:hypothetical protein